MKLVFAHIYVLTISYITCYFVLSAAAIAAALALHFIFWMPLTIPQADILGICARAIMVVSVLVTVLYAASRDYKDALLEKLSA
jgi:hypothetical protein